MSGFVRVPGLVPYLVPTSLLLLILLLTTPPLAGQERCPEAANPGTEEGWVALGEDRLVEARERFSTALDRCPFHLGARTGLAYVDLREGRDEEARAGFAAVSEADPESIDALNGLGILAWRRGDLPEVGRIFARVEALDPGNATASDYLGRLPAGYGSAPGLGPFVRPDTLEFPARAAGDYLEVRGPEGWETFYVRGINLGAALPGRNPSEFPDSAVYAEWIRGMGEMGANTVRVYTVHPPQFYSALRDYNLRHPEEPLWLLHGVWAELPPEHDYLDPQWEGDFFQEIRRVVDLIHGRADIAPRPGHASGFYRADVSPWVLGFVLGREWEPFSVLGFAALHPEFRSWDGAFLSVHGGNPMDAWMGRAVEETVRYEVEAYNHQRPVSYTNWPTLDPLRHSTETTVEEEVAIRTAMGEVVDVRPREYDNDAVGLDLTLLEATPAFPAGVFATFHAYPYYPDFMTFSPEYSGRASSLGPSDYFGYLRALKDRHPDVPVVIAEYGVPASLGVAHMQPQGWHHGGHTEEEMAAIDRRLTLEIAESGMAGGAIFAWIDEWFKKNWLTLEFALPPERNRLWLNRLDAEQQYGMMAMEAAQPVAGASLRDRLEGWAKFPALYEDAGGHRLRAAADEAYLWLHIELPSGSEAEEILVGFDLFDSAAGDIRWPGARGPELPVGLEFVLQVVGDEARILVDPPQNPFRFPKVGVGPPPTPTPEWPGVADLPGFFRARSEQRFNAPYVSISNGDGVYDSLRVITNRRRVTRDSTEILARGYDRGILRRGEGPDGLWEWSSDGRVLEVRIPWTLLNFTDPSQRRVLRGPSDDPIQLPGAVLSTSVVDGIRVVMGVRDSKGEWRNWPGSGVLSDVASFTWSAWEEPSWEARRRPVYQVLRETFGELDAWEPASSPGRPVPWSPSAGGSTPSPGQEAALAERANRAWNQGDTDEARLLYDSILAADSSDGRALHRLALMHAWQEEPVEALALFHRLLALEPENLDARVDRARVLAWEGDLDEAVRALELILEISPGFPPAVEARAQFQSWAGDYSEALTTYDQLVGISDDPTEAMLAQAQVLGWASRLEESRSVYDSILALNPRNLEARLGEARLLAFSDETDEAVARYEAILQDHPDNPEARWGLARALTWGGRLPDGERAWRSSLAASPGDLISRVGLAQNLRWQGRMAAAMDVLDGADPDQKQNADYLEQLQWVRAALDPRGEIFAIREGDSDDNVMWTTRMRGGWNPVGPLALQGEGYFRDMEQTALDLTQSAWGVSLKASYQLDPGWVFTARAGGTRTDGRATTSTVLEGVVLSPGRYPVGGGVTLSRYPLDATAQLVEQGVRVSSAELSGRWTPASGWRITGSAGLGTFTGEAENRRVNANAQIHRSAGRGFTLGLSHRYFGFDEDLEEYYFDPDYFGLSEVMGRWAWEPGRMGFLLEAAPGLQKVGGEGDYQAAFRTSARVAYRFGPGRELSLSGGYSSAGLQSFSTGAADYSYTALIFGGSWVF